MLSTRLSRSSVLADVLTESGPFSLFTLEDRPDLKDAVRKVDPKTLPEFISHDTVNSLYWERVYKDFPGFQFAACKGNEVVAAGYTVPTALEADDLPGRGWDAALEGGFEDLDAGRPPKLLCALLAVVDAEHQGRGMSRVVLEGMR